MTRIGQLPPAGRDEPHVVVLEKKAPVVAMPEIKSGAVPVLARFNVELALAPTAMFPNAMGLGVRDTPGAVPVPASDTRCGLPGALEDRLN